ncbi:MAG: hypothetical protein JWN43_4957, partial [Gammaproteobacteria bacterium]|nr:hypothetical protein [Gammaproteobacteria bacterium]
MRRRVSVPGTRSATGRHVAGGAALLALGALAGSIHGPSGATRADAPPDTSSAAAR